MKPGSRLVSVAMLLEPYFMNLCRKNGAIFIREEGTNFMRQIIQSFVHTAIAKAAPRAAANNSNHVVDARLAASVCSEIGLPFFGADNLSFILDEIVPQQNELSLLQASQRSDPQLKAKQAWHLFSSALRLPLRRHIELANSLCLVRRLIDTERASVANPSEANTVAFLCCKLDENTFRHTMSFLLARGSHSEETTGPRKKLMWDDGDISDNWDSCVCREHIGRFVCACTIYLCLMHDVQSGFC